MSFRRSPESLMQEWRAGGRGHAYAITVKYNAKARRLVEAIAKAGKKA